MELVADVLLIAGAVGAGIYCLVLARRLKRFNDLENGVGGAVAVLSAQVDDLTKTLAAAQSAADGSHRVLEDLTERAENVAGKLELMMASMHDIPDSQTAHTKEAGKTTASDAPAGVMFKRRMNETTGATL